MERKFLFTNAKNFLIEFLFLVPNIAYCVEFLHSEMEIDTKETQVDHEKSPNRSKSTATIHSK